MNFLMLFNIVITGKSRISSSILSIGYCRQSEVLARDTRQMKHIFVVKKGSIMIWKRLDPDGRTPQLTKHDLDQMEDEKSLT